MIAILQLRLVVIVASSILMCAGHYDAAEASSKTVASDRVSSRSPLDGLGAYQGTSSGAVHWASPFPGLNGDVMAIVVDGDRLYVGGSFTKAGDVTVNHIAVWDGTAWSGLGSGTDQRVNALAIDENGNVYAGGSFSTMDGRPVGFIARWDGERWDDLAGGMDQMVQALAIGSDGSVYAGGAFTRAGGEAANYIARWDGERWHNLGDGMDHNVFTIAPVGDGTLYAGGGFMTADGKDAHQVARWDGAQWHSVGMGIEMAWGRPVNALALADDGTLYAGGNFENGGGVSARNIARWDGHRWHAMQGGMNGVVRALAIDDGGMLYAGGYFTVAGFASAMHIARWDGRRWSDLGAGTDNIVSALVVDASGLLHVGGNFNAAGSQPAFYLACLTAAKEVGAENRDETPAGLSLEEIYPNPMRDRAFISLTMPHPGHASIEVYDILGRRRLTLLDRMVAAGRHDLLVDTAGLPNGAYVIRYGVDDFFQSRLVSVRR